MGAVFPPPPPAAVSRVLASFDRGQLEGFIAVAIDLLDLADGDPDLEDSGDTEPNGDECDTNNAEDEPFGGISVCGMGPGCPVSDEGGNDDGVDFPDYGEDQSRGPLNHHEATVAEKVAELGLERSPTGGWRWPK